MTRFGASGPGGPIARPRPIVGRTGERAVLQRARERAQAGEPTVVRIEGDAGLGKSALLRDLVRGDATGTALVRDGAAALDALGATPFAARARAANDGAEPARGPEPAPAGPATRPAGPPVGAPGEAPLTRAEVAVVERVAVGRTNREVAAELFVSVKTVESHLGRAFTKAGVRSRTELALWWRGHGDAPRGSG